MNTTRTVSTKLKSIGCVLLLSQSLISYSDDSINNRPFSPKEMEQITNSQFRDAQLKKTLAENQKLSNSRYIGIYGEKCLDKVLESFKSKNPDAFSGQSLSTAINIFILPNGTVRRINVKQSSSNKEFDEAVIQAVKSALPFEQFPTEMRGNTDVFVVSSQLTVTSTNDVFYKLDTVAPYRTIRTEFSSNEVPPVAANSVNEVASFEADIKAYQQEQSASPNHIIRYSDANGNLAKQILEPSRVNKIVEQLSLEINSDATLKRLIDAYKPISENYGRAFAQLPGKYDAEFMDSFEVSYRFLIAGEHKLQAVNVNQIKDENMKEVLLNAQKTATSMQNLLLGLLDKGIKDNKFSPEFKPTAQARLETLKELKP